MGVVTHTPLPSALGRQQAESVSLKPACILRPRTVRATYRDPVSEKELEVGRKVCFLGPEARTLFLPQYPTFTPLT